MNSLCTNCGGLPTKFCLCASRVSVLCDQCSPKHESNSPYEMHDWNPLSHYSVMQNLGADNFRMQKMQIMNGCSLVRKVIQSEATQYEQAKRELNETYTTYVQWLDYLHNSFLALVQKFEQEKTLPMVSTQFQLSPFTYYVFSAGDKPLPANFSLVESHPVTEFKREMESMQQRLYRNAGQLGNYEEYFVDAIKTGMNNSENIPDPPQISEPRYQQVNPAPRSSIQDSSPSYTLRQKQFETYIPFSRGRNFAKWDTHTGNLDRIELKRPLNLKMHSVSVVLPNGDLFCCGGRGNHGTLSIVIDGISGDVYSLGNLTTSRGCAGLVYSEQSLYLFGGFQGTDDLRSAEKFTFNTNSSWKLVRGQMAQARHQFTPAIHEKIVYICGGLNASSVETFHVVQETFRTSEIKVPKQFGTLALVYNRELLILQDKTLLRWRLGSDTVRVSEIGEKMIESNVVPQIFGTKAFFTKETDSKCEIYVMDLTDMSVKKMDGLKSSAGEPCEMQ